MLAQAIEPVSLVALDDDALVVEADVIVKADPLEAAFTGLTILP
jgi:hypothetical protein